MNIKKSFFICVLMSCFLAQASQSYDRLCNTDNDRIDTNMFAFASEAFGAGLVLYGIGTALDPRVIDRQLKQAKNNVITGLVFMGVGFWTLMANDYFPKC